MENHIGELFILPLAIIAVLLLYLIDNKHSLTTKRAWIISAIVFGIIITFLLILSITLPLGVGIILAFFFLLMFSVWTIAASLIIGTALSAFITWRNKSKPPPRKTIFILKKPLPNHTDNNKESDNGKLY